MNEHRDKDKDSKDPVESGDRTKAKKKELEIGMRKLFINSQQSHKFRANSIKTAKYNMYILYLII